MAKIASQAAMLLFLLVYFWVLVITAIDSALFYAVFPYRYFVAVALLVLLLFVPGRSWRFKLGLFLILAVWFSLLPRVSWHEESQFFIHAGTLRKGMTLEEAAAKMRPYIMTVSAEGDEAWFQPHANAEDTAIVRLREGKVREIILRHE